MVSPTVMDVANLHVRNGAGYHPAPTVVFYEKIKNIFIFLCSFYFGGGLKIVC